MKKVKLMLTAVAVFTVVGGALAFKAKDAYGTSLFVGTAANSCPTLIQNITSTIVPNAGGLKYVTTAGGSTTICVQSYTIARQ